MYSNSAQSLNNSISLVEECDNLLSTQDRTTLSVLGKFENSNEISYNNTQRKFITN